MSDETEDLLFGCLRMQSGLHPPDLHETAKTLLNEAKAILYCMDEARNGDAYSETEAGAAAMGVRSLIEVADFIYDDLHYRWLQNGGEAVKLVRSKGGAA